MSSKSVINLARKFANKYFNDKVKLAKYQQSMEDFYFETTGFLRTVLGEMEGDLIVLKNKNIDKNLYILLAKARNKISEFSLEIDPKNPYLGIQALINWADNRNNKAVLENLDFLLKHYSNISNIEFIPITNVTQAKTDSVENFLILIKALKNHLANNPMMPSEQDLIKGKPSSIIPPSPEGETTKY